MRRFKLSRGKSAHTIATQLNDVLDSYNFIHHVDQPTRNSNILDIIATNTSSFLSSTSVISSHHISDHSLITTHINVDKPNLPTTTHQFRPFHWIDYQKLDHAILKSTLITNPLKSVFYTQSINDIVTQELDKIAPVQNRKRKEKRFSWDMFLSSEAIQAKRQRRRLERLWKRTGDENIRSEYREACRSTNKLINDSRSNYLTNKVWNATGNAAEKCKLYRNLLHNKSVEISQGLARWEYSSILQ